MRTILDELRDTRLQLLDVVSRIGVLIELLEKAPELHSALTTIKNFANKPVLPGAK